MRLMVYGDCDPHTLETSYYRAGLALGLAVDRFDTRELARHVAPWLRQRLWHRLTIGSLALRRLGSQEWNARFREAVQRSRPDLVLLVKGDFVMPETVATVSRDLAPVFILHPDSPLPPLAANRPETVPGMEAADVYFTCARSLAPAVRAAGARRVEYLPFAWDPEVFPFVEEAESEAQVVFVGGWDREREELLEALAPRFEIKIWGPPYWQTRTRRGSAVRRHWQGRAVYGPDAADILRRARIAINVVRPADGDATNMRSFEVPGCGGFLLAKRTRGSLDVLPEGEAAAYFDDATELRHQVGRYLADDQARHRLKRRAHEIVAGSHTYVDRLTTILDVYRDWKGTTPARADHGGPPA